MLLKVSLITRHAVSNYGSLLQAYATQVVLEGAGHQVEVVDYVRSDESPQELERTLLKLKPLWNSNPIVRALYLALRNPQAQYAARAFESQRADLLRLSRRYSSSDELRSDPPRADVYVTGSDQVWGPVAADVYDDSYALTFAPDGSRRLAYAASFGKEEMPADARARFAAALRNYEYVTVREDSAVQQLARWGIASEQVLDPTLLLDASEWRAFSSPHKDGKYVLVYEIHNNPVLDRYAKRVACNMGLPLIRISSSLHQAVRSGHFRWLPTCREFVSYIDCAECLVTDSFHGTAFAINLNTPFVELLPDNGTSSRNMSLLRLSNLESRIVRSDDDFSPLERPVDFSEVNEALLGERAKSKGVLLNMIKGGCS